MLYLLLGFLLTSPARAETLLGHNLTPTSNTIPQGQVSAGNYAVAYGINDSLTVGTSPWMILEYNMPMIDVRYGVETSGYFERVSIEQMAFKTYEYAYDLYKQESTWTRLTATHRFNSRYTMHLDLGLQYFFNDQVPFSMRPIPINRTPLTWSTGALHEYHFDDHWGTFLETSLLGWNYPNRYLQLGLSGFYNWSGGYIQLGLSKSLPIGPNYITADQFDIWQNVEGVYRASVYYRSPAPFHPEIQVQVLL